MQNKEPEYIPEIVGLTKIQLFSFVFFAVLLGGTMFGLGTYLNYNSLNKARKKEAKYKQILITSQNEQDQETHILFGSFINPDDAKMLQTKIEASTGKTCLLIQKDNNIHVVLGPFQSKEIALNTMQLIQYRTQINGSLVHAV